MSLDENMHLVYEIETEQGRNAAINTVRGIYRRTVIWAYSLCSVAIASGTYMLLLLTDKAPKAITPLPAAAQNVQNILAEPSLEGTVKIAAGALAIISGCAAGVFAREAYLANRFIKTATTQTTGHPVYPELRLQQTVEGKKNTN